MVGGRGHRGKLSLCFDQLRDFCSSLRLLEEEALLRCGPRVGFICECKEKCLDFG